MSRTLPPDDATLTIGDVAARTGISIATLRAWEHRYGFPEPVRLENGHRRYRPSDVDRVQQISQHRSQGLAMPEAISRTRTPARASIYAALRAECPQLAPHRLTKRAMLAVSRAIEDECCAAGARPVLIGAFQTERFYAQSRSRWRDLARTAAFVAVMADFPTSRRTRSGVIEVALAKADTMRREWAVVCDAPGAAAVLAGWEAPGQAGVPQARRRFEAVWSADPRVVRQAARTALELVSAGAGRERSITEAQLPPLTSSPLDDLDRTTALVNRTIAELDR